MKNEFGGMIGQVHDELQDFGDALEGLERSDDGSYIVPADVMLTMVSTIQDIFSAWRRAQSKYSMAMASNIMCREEVFSQLIDKDDDGTVH